MEEDKKEKKRKLKIQGRKRKKVDSKNDNAGIRERREPLDLKQS